MANSKFPPFRVEKFRFSEHSLLWWHLSRTGISPQLGSFKCTSERKAFSPSRRRKKIIPQNLADLVVRSFLCPISPGSFLFCSRARETKPNLSYKNQDSDGYKGSDQQCQGMALLPLPHPMYVLHRKTKITNPQNTTGRIIKLIHPRGLEGRQDGQEGKWHRGENKVFKSV